MHWVVISYDNTSQWGATIESLSVNIIYTIPDTYAFQTATPFKCSTSNRSYGIANSYRGQSGAIIEHPTANLGGYFLLYSFVI